MNKYYPLKGTFVKHFPWNKISQKKNFCKKDFLQKRFSEEKAYPEKYVIKQSPQKIPKYKFVARVKF